MELIDDPTELLQDSCKNMKGCASPVVQNQDKISKQENKHYLKDIPLDFTPSKETSLSEVITQEKSLIHKGGEDSSDDEGKTFLTEGGKILARNICKSTSSLPSKYSFQKQQQETLTWKDSVAKKSNSFTELDKLHTEHYSGIRIINPLISFDNMQQKMNGRRMIKMSFIKACIRGGDIEGDWVTIGVLVNKLPPKTSKNGKTFSIWKMTDLHDCEKVISMFLFGAAHAEHWKTSVGSVIGFLNPSILPDKDKNSGDINLSIDHAGKLMLMGKSKDFSHCKGKRKDGASCTAVVNLSQCEYCIYHVKGEYKKFSAKRSELQAAYSGREPSLKDRVLKKQNFIYGGQMFTPIEKSKKAAKKCSSKDKLTLLNLGLKRKAQEIETEDKDKGVKKLAELYGPKVVKPAEKNSEFINNQLIIPSVGSRNLIQHILKDKSDKNVDNIKVITSKDLINMRDKYRKTFTSEGSDIIKDFVPQLGRGLKTGQVVNLDFNSTSKLKAHTTQDLLKMKAILKIKNKGPIQRQDPNAVKPSSDITTKVKAVLDNFIEEKKDAKEEKTVIKSRLGTIDMDSNKIQKILNRKSLYDYELEMVELEKQENYFNNLEKKEKMEEKMASTSEIVCDVISCKQCKYTAHQATDLCKNEGHPLKCHKAIKRFFACKDCKCRTCCFTKFPKRSCRNCGGSNFERTSMLKPRSGPKLDSEVLNIRGDEIKFLNSLK